MQNYFLSIIMNLLYKIQESLIKVIGQIPNYDQLNIQKLFLVE